MKDFFDAEWQATLYYEGKIKEALQQAILPTLVSLMKKGKLTEAEAAEEAGMSIADFKKAVAALA